MALFGVPLDERGDDVTGFFPDFLERKSHPALAVDAVGVDDAGFWNQDVFVLKMGDLDLNGFGIVVGVNPHFSRNFYETAAFSEHLQAPRVALFVYGEHCRQIQTYSSETPSLPVAGGRRFVDLGNLDLEAIAPVFANRILDLTAHRFDKNFRDGQAQHTGIGILLGIEVWLENF